MSVRRTKEEIPDRREAGLKNYRSYDYYYNYHYINKELVKRTLRFYISDVVLM